VRQSFRVVSHFPRAVSAAMRPISAANWAIAALEWDVSSMQVNTKTGHRELWGRGLLTDGPNQ
jgi:hypothetical protein